MRLSNSRTGAHALNRLVGHQGPKSTPCVLCKAVSVSPTASEAPVPEEPIDVTASWETVCPICLETPLNIETPDDESCTRCKRTFEKSSGYTDFTLDSGTGKSTSSQNAWLGAQTFRRKTVSTVYERGWRQSFAWAGFPGADKEFEYSMDYLQPQYGEGIVDLSCGSGLFTRRFAKSGKFSKVVAVDFSENMLIQTGDFIKEDKQIDASKIKLIRADVCRLPFKTGSVSAIHAGAAIHCWEYPSLAAAEISRVLKPGGTFVGSTFLNFTAPLGQLLGDDSMVEPLSRLDPGAPRAQFKWWSETELRDTFSAAGLQDFKCQRDFRFILWSVTKPE